MMLKRRLGRAAVNGLVLTSVITMGLLVMSVGTAGASLSLIIPDTSGAGYFTSGLAPTSASATFVVPAFTCTGVQQDLITVEVNWPNLIAALDEVSIVCSGAGAVPTYGTFVEGPGGPGPIVTTLAVSPGDKLKASVSGSTSSLVDVTTKAAVTVNGGPEPSGGDNAAFTLSRTTLDPTTPTFGTLTFKAMTVDGSRLSAAASFTQDMTSASSIVQVLANPIAHGTGTLVFQHI